MSTPDDLKREAASAALDFVEPGMRLGLGTGSTSEWFLRLLAGRIRDGLDVAGVPTSERTATLAGELGVPLLALDEVDGLDLAVDGADEFDASMTLIKGGGGALLREKIVASDAARMVVITDGSKRSETVGRFPLPIEVVPFGYAATLRAIARAARDAGLHGALVRRMRPDGSAFLTDQGNWIVDASFRLIPRPETLATALQSVPGLVEHGLFIRQATTILVAESTGVTRLDRQPD